MHELKGKMHFSFSGHTLQSSTVTRKVTNYFNVHAHYPYPKYQTKTGLLSAIECYSASNSTEGLSHCLFGHRFSLTSHLMSSYKVTQEKLPCMLHPSFALLCTFMHSVVFPLFTATHPLCPAYFTGYKMFV